MKMDKIIMRGLSFSGRHGLLPDERDKPQPFKVDLVLYLDLKTAGLRDDIACTVDYSLVYQEVQRLVEEESYSLIETLAEQISRRVLVCFPLLAALEITVYKPEAPIKGEFDHMAVQIYRSREQEDFSPLEGVKDD
ncbi:MAG: dihydroneopterin aldolase [Syntrophomonadaceae bacterium]